MSPILHQLKKDVLRLWPLLALWCIFLVAQAVIGVQVWDEERHTLPGISNTLLNLHRVFAILLTALVILEEPLAGTRGFWLARPLSRVVLMVSKLLFVLLFVAGPAVLAELGALTSLGLELERWPTVAAETLFVYGGFVMLTAVLAVLAPNLRTFALIGVVALLVGTIGGHWLLRGVQWAFGVPVAGPTIRSQTLLSTLLVLLFGGGLVVHQYLTRNTRRSLVWMALAAPLVLLIPRIGSWDLLRPTGDLERASMRLTLDQPSTGFSWGSSGDDSSRKVHALLKLEEAEPGYFYRVIRTVARLRLDEGPTLRSTSHRIVNLESGEQVLDLGNGEIFRWEASRSLVDLLALPEADYERWADRKGLYTARIRIQPIRYELMGELPVVAGSQMGSGFDRVVLDKVEVMPSRFVVRLSSRSLLTFLDRRAPNDPPPLMVLRHPAALELRASSSSSSSGSKSLVVSHPFVGLSSQEHEFERAVTAEELGDSRLVVARRVLMKSFELPFEIEDFRMKDYTVESWQDRVVQNARRAAARARDGS